MAVQKVRPGSFSTCFDEAAGFWKKSLSPAVRGYFAFIVNGEWFRTTRLPIGWTIALAIQQCDAEILAASVA